MVERQRLQHDVVTRQPHALEERRAATPGQRTIEPSVRGGGPGLQDGQTTREVGVGTTVPVRVRWAVEVLDPQPGEHVLEVGCGPGAAAELVCPRLGDGHLLAVDRSPVAVARTLARCAPHVAAGRLQVTQAELSGLDLPRGALDAAFCVDVNVFWTGPASRELAALRAGLRAGGRLLVLYGAGPTASERLVDRVAAALREGGFDEVEVLTSPDGCGVRGRVPGSPERLRAGG